MSALFPPATVGIAFVVVVGSRRSRSDPFDHDSHTDRDHERFVVMPLSCRS